MPLSLTPTRLGVFMAFGAIIGWSFNFIFARSLAGVVPPFTLSLLRTAVALAVFAPFTGKALVRCWPVIRKRPVFYIFIALMGLGYYNALLYVAARTTPAVNLALLAMSSPMFTLILSRFVLGEPLTKRRLFGLAAAVCGVTLLAARGNLAMLAALTFHPGDAIMLFAAFCFACYSVSLGRIDQEVRGNTFIFLMFVISFVFLLPPAAWELSQGMNLSFTPMAVTGIFYLGIVASIFCYICWNGAIARLGPGNVALLYYTMPLISGFEAAMLLDESLQWFHFASGALIITGVLVATRK